MRNDAIVRLSATGEKLPAKLRDEILGMGPAAVPRLVALLEDESWAAVHAADLLVDLRASEAIEPMLSALSGSDSDDYLCNRLVIRLPELGAAVLEPALSRLATADDDQTNPLCEIVANLGVKDERIFETLSKQFLEHEPFWAGLLATYGDPRALPLIEAALAAFEPDFASLLSRVDLNELLDAHQRLGGVLSSEQQEEFDGWFHEWSARFSLPSPPVRSRKVGRNESCPCGSGKKYKKCCLDAREGLAAARPFFAEKDAGRGPTPQILEFARPLLDSTDGSEGEMQSMLTLSVVLWNVATMDADDREKELSRLASKFEGDLNEEFWQMAHMMLDRHRTMFPELHGGQAT